jgi:hypothetical protein
MTTKICGSCGEQRSVTDFYRNNAAKDGLRPECKRCSRIRRKAWYEANRQGEIERAKAWQQQNPDRHSENQRRRRARPDIKRRERDAYLQRTFGITLDEYDEMLRAQGGRCGICGRSPRPDISLHVDHDHRSGAIRGLLCFPCNNAVGLLRDDIERVGAVRAYLIDHDGEMQDLAERARARLRALVAAVAPGSAAGPSR